MSGLEVTSYLRVAARGVEAYLWGSVGLRSDEFVGLELVLRWAPDGSEGLRVPGLKRIPTERHLRVSAHLRQRLDKDRINI